MKKTVGFIGLGLMGKPMAEQFLTAGYQVVAFDRAAERLQELVELGAEPATSPKDVADRARVVIGSLPHGTASRAVTMSAHGILNGRLCKYYIETSTIGVRASRQISERLALAGIIFVDAPVSGGPRAVRERSLTAMISAAANVITELDDWFLILCKRRFVVGTEAGLAQACKLVNNAISLSTLQIAAETVVFGVKAGLDAKILIDAINSSSGQSATTLKKFPVSILTRRFDYGASLETGAKDMDLFIEEAREMGLLLESTPAIADSWRAASQAGPALDFTEIIKRFEAVANVEVGEQAAD